MKTALESLALLTALAAAAGCAAVAPGAPSFGKGWQAMYETAQDSASYGGASPAPSMPWGESDAWEHAAEEAPEAVRALKAAREAAQAGDGADTGRMRQALRDLDEAEGLVARKEFEDPAERENVRKMIEEMRRWIEAKLISVLRIEPNFDLRKPKNLRIALIRVGEGVETLRAAEKEAWKKFLALNGFETEPVFIPACLVADVGAGSVRGAAARLHADAVLAYTVSSRTDSGPLSGSAAVLTFAKCMLLDVRSEYLYLNAEGECRRKRIGLPGCVSARGLELECAAAATEGMRAEILRELKRLAED